MIIKFQVGTNKQWKSKNEISIAGTCSVSYQYDKELSSTLKLDSKGIKMHSITQRNFLVVLLVLALCHGLLGKSYIELYVT